MGKRNRQQRRAAQRKSRQVASSVEKAVRNLLAAATDPARSVDEVAPVLLDLYRDQHVPGEVAFVVSRKSSNDRARALGDAALALEPKSLAALTLAASVAEAAGDEASCAAFYEKALEVSPDSETRWCYAAALQAAGRNTDALQQADPLFREDPCDFSVQDVMREALREAWDDIVQRPSSESCRCGSGRTFGNCCREPAILAVHRFEDRTPFDEFRQRIFEYSERSSLRPFVEHALHRWLEARDLPPSADGEQRFFVEWSWGVVEGEDADDDDEEVDDCIMIRFANDPLVATDVRERAGEWLGGAQWGLWMVRDPSERPGITLTDLLTSTRVYTAIPPEQLEGIAPWSVLFGLLVPFDGVWRTAATFVELSPSTADRLARRISEMVMKVASALSGRRRARTDPDVFGGLPPSAAAEHAPPAAPHVRDLFNKVISVSVPHLYELIDDWSKTLPALANTDGDPLAFITAEISVDDETVLLDRLREHPDFDVREDEIIWLGKEMSRAELEVAKAEFEKLAKEYGTTGALPRGTHRFTRGSMRLGSGVLTVQVNSRERVRALERILADLGADPRVRSEVAADPVQDLGLGLRGAPPKASQSDRAGIDAWARAWVDEPVPALEGLTPRTAAADERGRVLLEALLRDFEHRAAANRARGVEDLEIEDLRIALGMV